MIACKGCKIEGIVSNNLLALLDVLAKCHLRITVLTRTRGHLMTRETVLARLGSLVEGKDVGLAIGGDDGLRRQCLARLVARDNLARHIHPVKELGTPRGIQLDMDSHRLRSVIEILVHAIHMTSHLHAWLVGEQARTRSPVFTL